MDNQENEAPEKQDVEGFSWGNNEQDFNTTTHLRAELLAYHFNKAVVHHATRALFKLICMN